MDLEDDRPRRAEADDTHQVGCVHGCAYLLGGHGFLGQLPGRYDPMATAACVPGTAAAKPFDKLLQVIRDEATTLPRPAPKRKAVRARRHRKTPLARYLAPPYMIG